MSMSERMVMSELIRRLELFTGAGRRRTWSEAEKAAIVAESEGSKTSVRAVARRHGLSASQLFTWRRLARDAATSDRRTELRFVPAVLGLEPPEPATTDAQAELGRRLAYAGIEVEVAGATVRIRPGASAAQIAAVIGVLKASV